MHRASYRALLAGLFVLNQDLWVGRGIHKLTCQGDDAIVISQLRGEKECTDPDLLPLLRRVRQYVDAWGNFRKGSTESAKHRYQKVVVEWELVSCEDNAQAREAAVSGVAKVRTCKWGSAGRV